ncbi:hypothetical protein OG21DRAFT_1599831, partial [Imleria badia]
MLRKTRKIHDASSDDDAPEVVSHSTSKADAKRNQKALHDFEVDEQARRKARNRERDQKLKERARVTKGGKTGEKIKGVRFMDQAMAEEDGGESGDDVEARMLRAMRDAAGEVESGEGDHDNDDDDGEFMGFGQGMDLGDDMASGSDSSLAQDGDDGDAKMSLGESDSIDADAPTDDEEMDDDEDTTSLQAPNIHRASRKANYLADDLFAAAFASQNSKLAPKKSAEAAQQQTIKKRRRKFIARPKDLVIGGRTIRTLPRPSDPRSQATARSVPSARARRFVDQSLAMKGKQALLKAKKKGWERRPANVGIMKHQGAPHAFARSKR